MSKATISVSIRTDVIDRLRQRAEEDDRTVSATAERILSYGLDAPPKKSQPKTKPRVIQKAEPIPHDDLDALFDYLNEKAGTRFSARHKDGKLTAGGKLAAQRLKEFSLNELLMMVDAKDEDWASDEKMHKFMRPTTLFGPKCSEYVGATGKTKASDRRPAWMDRFINSKTDDNAIEGEFKRET